MSATLTFLVRIRADILSKSWEESKHPRDAHGEFSASQQALALDISAQPKPKRAKPRNDTHAAHIYHEVFDGKHKKINYNSLVSIIERSGYHSIPGNAVKGTTYDGIAYGLQWSGFTGRLDGNIHKKLEAMPAPGLARLMADLIDDGITVSGNVPSALYAIPDSKWKEYESTRAPKKPPHMIEDERIAKVNDTPLPQPGTMGEATAYKAVIAVVRACNNIESRWGNLHPNVKDAMRHVADIRQRYTRDFQKDPNGVQTEAEATLHMLTTKYAI